jgi:hypothetical protein
MYQMIDEERNGSLPVDTLNDPRIGKGLEMSFVYIFIDDLCNSLRKFP